jgi:hypothetical protein
MSEPQLTEEELRAIEAEMEQMTPDEVLLRTLFMLINLGVRKAGLAAPPGEEGVKRDLEQARECIDGARAILPLLEKRHAEELRPVKDALSQLQMAYVQAKDAAGGEAAAPEEPPAGGESGQQPPAEGQAPDQGGPGPAQKSGRLWVPGQ